ncbi:hypothetical protein ID98_003663 [Salmonella enterica subsp. enterica serovar Kokomlemle]|nr:hypothetical protein [Salmonella enterica subsp. enterica serovar Vitkin]EDR5776370.1 hypothetical protein [Salmonella enterica subsp. enterica serovar Kokomlemle]EDR0838615.1 hypothetical protein [Salmonella enterica subsp. enterica serovar Vitkin]EDT0685803.1 hypothetical protein [Salmonella enterica subsp. enterica serovar Kokomlemle]EDT5577955.1 hypothetical protein [Salmonella enterica subsp. enterica serovar Kokomlemle]
MIQINISNVRSWHTADKITALKVRSERAADVGNCPFHPTIMCVNQRGRSLGHV